MSFAAFDWLMSLSPTWFSTVFGVYFFAGSFVSALSVLAMITAHARGKDSVGAFVSVEHTHNIGKLMLAFVCFWTYIAFSQLLLIWIAGLPEETPFYITRFKTGWAPLGILLVIGNFFVPFGALLSRSLKRDPRKLAAVAFWLLLVHLVDIYWLVMPTFSPDQRFVSTGRRSRPSWASVCSRSPSASRACAVNTPCRSRIPTSPTLSRTGSHNERTERTNRRWTRGRARVGRRRRGRRRLRQGHRRGRGLPRDLRALDLVGGDDLAWRHERGRGQVGAREAV